MWRNEKEFVEYLIDKLSSEGAECSRIETPATGVGIPDMFIQGAGDDLFIEAKLLKIGINDLHDKVKIPWRPGQVAWASKYSMLHKTTNATKHSWTLVGLTDGVLAIRMGKAYSNSTVYTTDVNVIIWSKQELRSMNLFKFLISYTYTKSKEVK